VRVRVRVRAAPWVPVPEVRVVVDGKVVEVVSLDPWAVGEDGVTRHELDLEMVLTRDSWVLAEAGWPLGEAYPEGGVGLGKYAWVAPGYLPVGFTNPVWLDWDHDGTWMPRSRVEVALDAEPVPPSILVPKTVADHRAKQKAKAAAKAAEKAAAKAGEEATAADPPETE
jgi:hypothetical protein